jgi:hypothetical protein
MSETVFETAEAALAHGRALAADRRYAEGAVFTAQAVAAHPLSADLWNLHGVMLRMTGRPREALVALDRALALKPDHHGGRWNRANVVLDLARAVDSPDDRSAAEAVIDEGLAVDPESPSLLEVKASLLLEIGDRRRAQAFLASLLARGCDFAWMHRGLGGLLADRDPARAEAHLLRARALEPDGLVTLLALLQLRSRATGANEGASLDEAHALAVEAAARGGYDRVVRDAFSRVCDFEGLEKLGPFRDLGRRWAQAGQHTALMRHIACVRDDADRLELLEQHRIWGRLAVAAAERRPIRRPPPRPPGCRIRLGLLSSDLRRHPVGYFVEPLFEHLDPTRFELFCYGFDPEPSDALQTAFARRAAAFRKMPDVSAREAAQAIADDDLDVLIELGGSTQMNRLEVMAWRPAPLAASWLGYPHSAGLSTIDGLICDPRNAPTRPDLLDEAPWVMPHSWISLGPTVFDDQHAIDPLPPEARTGSLTFGTANNPYKYTREALAAWAGIVAAVPGSRFAFLRPEGGSKVFREHVAAEFAKAGVGADRLDFLPVRGSHMPHYNAIDVTLDTFPLTGGTTTVEALWMGAPVVSLRGPAFYERLSASILGAVGLDDLVADDLESYRRAAIALAADGPRRAALRQELRGRMRGGALGDAAGFARDFYDLVERKVRSSHG